MIADIMKTENGYLVHFERKLHHPIEAVWSMLTDNEQLERWFQELRVGELREGGFMKFNMPGVINQELEIKEMIPLNVLEFDWFGDGIRFELYPDKNGSTLILKEKISAITEQTKKDIAGWHVCLDVIEALLDRRVIERDEEWKKWYERYTKLLRNLKKSH